MKILDHAVYDYILKVKTHLNFTELSQVALRGNCTGKYLRCDGQFPKLVDFTSAQLWEPMKYPDGAWTFENQWHYLTIDNTGRVICQGTHYNKRYEMLMLERLAGIPFLMALMAGFLLMAGLPSGVDKAPLAIRRVSSSSFPCRGQASLAIPPGVGNLVATSVAKGKTTVKSIGQQEDM